MEHASIGEARVRALLVERFWVLERSVDVEGADYLIQLPPHSLRDLDAPIRLGRVQAKFVQDQSGAAYVPKEYVQDPFGRAYEQFFVLVSTGEPDAEQLSMLSAAQIASDFTLAQRGPHRGRFRLPARRIFVGGRYEPPSRTALLDAIERAVRAADRSAIARFWSAGLGAIVSRAPLDSEYSLPLWNWYGDFAQALEKVHRGIESVELDMDDVLEALRRTLRSGDPLEVEALLDDNPISGFLRGDEQGFTLHDVFNSDFFDAARDYRRRLQRLRASGQDIPFFRLATAVQGEVVRILRRRGPSIAGPRLIWSLEYAPVTLGLLRLEVRPNTSAPPGGGPVGLYLDANPVVEDGRVTITKTTLMYPPPSLSIRPGRPAPKDPSWAEFSAREASAIAGALMRLVEARVVREELSDL